MPPRKKKQTTTTSSSSSPTSSCQFPGCTQAPWGAIGDSPFCLLHLGVDLIEKQAQQAQRRKKPAQALLLQAGARMLNAPGVQEALTARIAAFARGFAAPPPQPPAAAAPDPFAVLGLDRSRATIEDVQRVQRHMAKLYHTDASSGGVAADAMARVNEAAAAAIQILRAS